MRKLSALGIALCLCAIAHRSEAATLARVGKMQVLVDSLKTRLSIPERVVVSVVPRNPLLVSVVRVQDADATFTLSIEESFLDALGDDELDSVIAHELGHVWIFTHHPFLQTEEGANEIALRIVSRESLDRLYEKTWQRAGPKGDIAYVPLHGRR